MNFFLLVLLVVATGLSFQTCQKDDVIPPVPIPNKVQLTVDATFGSILTDSQGKSLYFFADDANASSHCVNGCLNNWPIFYEANITIDNGLDIADFGTINRADWSKQTTYYGWSLYYYVSDVKAGDTFGDGVNGDWFIAKPNFSVMHVFNQLTGHDGVDYLSNYTTGVGETGYIVDSYGNTLYTFSHDSNNINTITASDFGSIDVYGKTQLTDKGWSLYYFGQDSIRGDNKGISFPISGGV
jgi:predicted lipoprotein with Yx(FWY)xxD motif